MSVLKKFIQNTVYFLFSAFALTAVAHHGSITNPAMYLAENLVEIEGEIVDVFWRNPHPRYKLEVSGDSSMSDVWELELSGSPTGYLRQGLTADDIAKVGDQVRVAGYISKGDSKSLGVLHMLLTNGQEFVYGRDRPLRWSSVRMTAETLALDPIKVEIAKQSADGLFRVWGGIRAPEIEVANYAHMLTERGRALQDAYDLYEDNYELRCLQGMPSTMFDRGGAPMEVIDQGDRILLHLQEYDVERVIHMNVQQPTEQPEPSRLGYSVGHWEGDDLIVTTAHIDWPYYDEIGVPQSLEAVLHERFSVSEDGNQLNYQITIDDPVVFSEPMVLGTTRAWIPGLEVQRYDCVATWED